WLAEIYSNHGATLEFISDGTPETVQFIQGFGGIGGILRWKREDYDIAGSESDGYFQKGDVDDEYAEFF
ncbi:translation termination factor eRF1, partial [Coemansia sp. RSA 2704]